MFLFEALHTYYSNSPAQCKLQSFTLKLHVSSLPLRAPGNMIQFPWPSHPAVKKKILVMISPVSMPLARNLGNLGELEWLPRRDSNPNKQNQNLRCYHYTTRQSRVLSVLAGSTGLEPATPGSTVQCANQLRHNPVFQKVMCSIP